MRRIGWQGCSRALAIREQLEQRVQQWRLGWFGKRLNELAVVVDESGDWPGNEIGWHLASSQGGMWIQATDNAGIKLAAEALQLPEQGTELIFPVGEACFEDLRISLWNPESSGKPDSERAAAGEAAADLTRYGGMAYSIVGLPVDLVLLVDRGWCEAQLPPQSGRRPPLTDRRKAIGFTRVAMKATIDLGEIPLIESMGWSPGELLLTDTPRTPQANLTLADRRVHGGLMGVRANKKVLAIS